MLELGNLNGLGVLQNNHANILRQMASSRKGEASFLLSRAVSLYKSAIEKAISLSRIGNVDSSPPVCYKSGIELTILNSESDNTKVLSRMLGLALVYMDQSLSKVDDDQLNESLDIFKRVLEIYDKDENWKGLAILGFLVTSHKISETRRTIFHEIVGNANSKSQKSLEKYVRFSGKLISSDYSALFKLCYNIWWFGGDINYILYPLLNIPQTPKALLYRFAFAVVDNHSLKATTQKNANTSSGMEGEGEGEGETFTPGQQVPSAPPFRLETFEEHEENEGKYSSTRPTFERIQKVVDLHMSAQFTTS